MITYTRKRGRRAARPHPARSCASAGRHDLARELDGAWISTIHGFCNRLLQRVSVRGRARPALPRARRGAGRRARAARRSSEALERVLRRRATPSGSRLLATYGAQRPAADAHRRLRDAPLGRAAARARAGRAAAARRARSRSCATPRGASPTTPTRPSCSAQNRRALLELVDGDPSRRAAARPLRAHGARGERAADVRGGAQARSSRRRSTSSRRATATCSRSCSTASPTRTRRRSGASRRSTSRTSSSSRATCSATTSEIREREQLRFRAIMVDEFQDTNRLQCELDRPDRRRPGEPRCSSSATSSSRSTASGTPTSRVFRERREADGRRARARRGTTARGRRCSPPSTTSSAASSATGSSRSPRRASSPTRSSATRSSCSSPTRRRYADTGDALAPRRGAAHRAPRARARRRRGAATPGEIVLLFAAGTDAEWYEEELRALGLPTYRATGRGYFGQQQVVDLLAYLRLLHNRYDDQALVSVLASPFVGVSNDALVLHPAGRAEAAAVLGHRARRCRRTLPSATRACCARSSSATSGSWRPSPRLSLERLCEQIVAEHDYDLAVLAQWDGRRRYANLRKLARLARSYEELRGPDIEGFVRFVARAGGGRREGARGGRGGGGRRRGAAADDPRREGARVQGRRRRRRGPRHGARPTPTRSSRSPTGASASASPIRRRARAGARSTTRRCARSGARRSEAERLRLYYVAMTRAIDRLIVSGAIDRERERGPRRRRWAGCSRGSTRRRSSRAGGRLRSSSSAATRCSCVRVDRSAPEPAVRRRSRAGASRGPARALRRGCRQAPLAAGADAAGARAVAGAAAASPAPAVVHRARRPSSAARTATTPSASPGCARATPAGACRRRGPRRDRDRQRRARAAGAASTSRAPARAGRLRGAGAGRLPGRDRRGTRAHPRAASPRTATRSSPRASPALDGVAQERHFTFEHDGVLLHGFLDVVHADGGRALVVDYKTNVLEDAEPEEIVERRLPAPAARLRARVLPRRRRGGRGRLPVPRAAGRAGRRRRSRVSEVPELEAELSAAIARDPRRRVPADAERVRLRGLPGARRRLRRAAAAAAARGTRRGGRRPSSAGRGALRRPRQPAGARGGAGGGRARGVDRTSSAAT